jgi:hypothetical protein
MKWKEVVWRFCNRKPAKGGGWCSYHGDHYRDVSAKEDGKLVYYYHDNPIAELDGPFLRITHCGYVTPTTRDRLSAIVGTLTGRYSVHIMLNADGYYNSRMYFGEFGVPYSYFFSEAVIHVPTGNVVDGDIQKFITVRRLGRSKVNDFNDYITVKDDWRTFVILKETAEVFKVVRRWCGNYVCVETDPRQVYDLLESDEIKAKLVESKLSKL